MPTIRSLLFSFSAALFCLLPSSALADVAEPPEGWQAAREATDASATSGDHNALIIAAIVALIIIGAFWAIRMSTRTNQNTKLEKQTSDQ